MGMEEQEGSGNQGEWVAHDGPRECRGCENRGVPPHRRDQQGDRSQCHRGLIGLGATDGGVDEARVEGQQESNGQGTPEIVGVR